MKQLLFAFLLAIASIPASAQVPTAAPNNCSINPGACQPAPVPSDCKPGYHWTLIGSGIAHCVQDDPPCAGGTVNHDALGNPTNCQTSATRSQSCGSGYTGTIKQQRAVYTWMDGSTTYGSWSTTSSTCKVIPPPPAPEPIPEPTPVPAAPNPTPGPTTSPAPTTCANGATNYPTCTPPTCSNGASNYPTCTPPTCANGASNYPTCTPPTCANGAPNYPVCTFAAQPTTCERTVEVKVWGNCSAGNPSKWDERDVEVCRYSDGRVVKTEWGFRQFVRSCVGQGVTER